MILRANCKINLGSTFCAAARRFHDLETVMFPVAGLYDEVVVRTGAFGNVYGRPYTGAFQAGAVDCAPANICLGRSG